MKMWHPDVAHTRTEPVERSDRQFDAVWRDLGWLPWPPTEDEEE